ncbi:hypothetical protein ACXY7D_15065 [Sphingomonas melonis]
MTSLAIGHLGCDRRGVRHGLADRAEAQDKRHRQHSQHRQAKQAGKAV